MTVLVVGGTGMLACVVHALLDRGTVVVSVARNAGRLGAHPLLTEVVADWADPSGLQQAIRDVGVGFDTAVLWVHTEFRAGVYPEVVAALSPGATVVEVNGSRGARPESRTESLRMLSGGGRTVRRVVLGSVFEDGRRRWLSHGEICAGVLSALERGAAEHVVGDAPEGPVDVVGQ